MALIKCPHCGANISDRATKCPKCGTAFGAPTVDNGPRFCTTCGAARQGNENFCTHCGAPFNNVSYSGGSPAAYSYNGPSNQYQPTTEVDEEEPLETWKKIVSVLVWPIGAIITILLWVNGEMAKGKSAFGYTIAGLVLSIIFSASYFSISKDDLSTEVEQIMVDKMKENGNTLVVSDLTLTHKGGNEYTGLAKCTLDGKRIDLNVNVISDGTSVQAEWTPTAEYIQKAFEEGFKETFDNLKNIE